MNCHDTRLRALITWVDTLIQNVYRFSLASKLLMFPIVNVEIKSSRVMT